jgi:hypothetical protein
MVMANTLLSEDYWENFELGEVDVEFIYNHLLELETPLTSTELLSALLDERIQRELHAAEEQRTAGGDLYLPKNEYEAGQKLVFPALNWRAGEVQAVRPGYNPDLGEFQVLQVAFDTGETREFAAGMADHVLNDPPKPAEVDANLNAEAVLEEYSEVLEEALDEELESNPGFVRIAGRWFPRSLLLDVNIGHLNLAEALLDMSGGGPLPTQALIEQVDLPTDVNPKLVDFSFDFALQEDPRFDEVGPAGDVQWFLRRLEPKEVLEPPVFLRYAGIDYDRTQLTEQMLDLERSLDDELSPLSARGKSATSVDVRLIYPHWRAGSLPLSPQVRHLFPTAYEAPRIRFMLVDGSSGEKFPGWVVREKRYVFGLKEWYEAKNLMPGSIVHVRKGKQPGEVIVDVDARRSNREWIRTVLVGSDGGVVFAMLKQVVTATFDERMAIAVPDSEALDQVWTSMQKERPPFERTIVNMVRELAKLNPQSHVHATELYASINVVRRCPPGPLLAVLASRPEFVHVGDLHFRYEEPERA